MTQPCNKAKQNTLQAPNILLDLAWIHRLRILAEGGADLDKLVGETKQYLLQTRAHGAHHLMTIMYLRAAFFLSLKDAADLYASIDNRGSFEQDPMESIHSTQDEWSSAELRNSEATFWTSTIQALEKATALSLSDLRKNHAGSSVYTSDDSRHTHKVHKLWNAPSWTLFYQLNDRSILEMIGVKQGEIRLSSDDCPICSQAKETA